MSKKLENAIIIGGKVYELIDDYEGDECDLCAFTGNCDCINDPICVMVFDDANRKRFEERTDL
jgi:hypothetical protein